MQVTELNLGSGVQDASLWKLKYEYGEIDSNGNVNTVKNTGNIARMTTSFNGLANPFVQSFKYDSLYRLTEARETANNQQTWKQNFTYDRYGNRLTHDKFIGTTQQVLDNKTHPTINPQTNRFNTNQGYQYDFNGNLISDAENRQFTFNGDNKQSEIKINNAPVGRYFYDGEGKRVKKITNLETVVFVYDGLGKMVAEYSTAQPPPNPTTSYTATDQLGSPRVITNSNGEVTSRRDFMPFGEELTPDSTYRTANLKYNLGDNIRQKFTGYQKDEETGLDFAEARMYENRHARFTAVDPLLASGKSANPQTFNRYVYVMNNPLVLTDSSGLQAATTTGKRWFMPITPDGVKPYVFGDSPPSDYKEVTERNRVGELVGSGVGLSEDFSYRFNPSGPMSSMALAAAASMGVYDKITPYERNGYDITYSDTFRDKVNNDIHPGLEPAIEAHDIAFFAMPFKASVGSRSFQSFITQETTSGFSAYARRDAAIRAEVAVKEFLEQNPKANQSVLVGAADIQSTTKIAMTNGEIPSVIGARMQRFADRIGGLGANFCGTTVGRCAEFRAANALELRGVNPENIMFSIPRRANRPVPVEVCLACQSGFRPNQFPGQTKFRDQ